MDNCVFCKIIAGEIPSTTVYEDDDVKVICDIAPAALGHLLVLPKEHAEDITCLSEEKRNACMKIAAKLVAAQKKGLKADGVNLIQNNGEAAGQTVKHFHIHLIPRYDQDGLGILWQPTEPGFPKIGAAAEQIKEAL